MEDAGEVRGFALRQEQRFTEAEAVFAGIAARGDASARVLTALAQTRYELGLPAAALFAQAQQAMPANLDIARNCALAMAAEGDGKGADRLLTTTLAANPGWLDGHKVLASLRWTGGDAAHFADSYAIAVRAEPANAALWLAWFGAVAQTRDWAAGIAILDAAERALGATPAILVSRLFVAGEAGEAAAADALLAQTAHIRGDTISLCRIRHFLRQGRVTEAQEIALPLVATPSATLFWPYLSAIWRLLGDARAGWLDRPDVLIQSLDAGMSSAELTELADVLRALHVMARPYADQSVRGGTQTDRSVILRHEPILQTARVRWMAAIREYIAGLPPFEDGHPLLGTPREQLLVQGSWSVRLLQQGYNVAHTHPMGWISTVLYVAQPEPVAAAPAGHIAFGTPPAELGTALPPYRLMAPEPGRIAIFPSTMWHGTVPFDDGERLVMALDIAVPRY